MASKEDTPVKTGMKREFEFSPNNSSPSMSQTEKLARVTSPSPTSQYLVSDTTQSETVGSSEQRDTVFHLSEVICATLQNHEFIQSIIPMIADRVLENIRPHIDKIVEHHLEPYVQSIQNNKAALSEQDGIIKEQSDIIQRQNETISNLNSRLNKVTIRIEQQEQYSRRTSLRFNNVPVPKKPSGEVITPIDTDSLVLNICNGQLGLNLVQKDIGRSHPIGEIRDGKASIIVRFLTYRQRNMVFSNKKNLKNNKDSIFICENLTKHRYALIRCLSKLRAINKIHSFWTHDGTIIAKRTAEGKSEIIRNKSDVVKLGGVIADSDVDY